MATIGNTSNQKILDKKERFYELVGQKRVDKVVNNPQNEEMIKTLRGKSGLALYTKACKLLNKLEDESLTARKQSSIINAVILLLYAIEPVQRVTQDEQTKYYGRKIGNKDVYDLSDETKDVIDIGDENQ